MSKLPAVQNRSFQTNKNSLNMLQVPKMKPHKNSKEDEARIGKILTRRTAMQDSRGILDRRWSDYMRQYEALFVPYPDGRSSSNVPLERAIIELAVSELQKRQTQFLIEESVGQETEEFLFERVWRQDWKFYKRGNEILENDYTSCIFGTSWLFTGFGRTERIVSDLSGLNEKGGYDFQKKKIEESKVLVQNLDPRNVWVDDRARIMDQANDCIIEEYVIWEELQRKKFDTNYTNIDVLIPEFIYNENSIFTTLEEKGKQDLNYVKITKYWNREADEYIEIGNDKVIIRRHPLINASHELPIVPRQYSKNMFGIYGYGLCEALQMFKSEINDLREMLMDAVRRSNQEIVAIGGGLVFDGIFGYDNQIHQYSGGNLAGNFQQITGTPPNSAIFSYLERLYQDIAIFVGIDIQNLLTTPNQTAFQTAVQKESSLARINAVIKNRDVSMERFADLHKDNLQMFYPLSTIKSSLDIDSDGKVTRDRKKPTVILEDKDIENGKVIDKAGKRKFEISAEDIRGDFSLDVYTDLNQPVLSEVEKQQKLEFFQTIGVVIQGLSVSPELQEAFPAEKVIRETARMFGIDIEKGTGGDTKEALEGVEQARKQIEGLTGGTPAPAVPGEEGLTDEGITQDAVDEQLAPVLANLPQ